MGNRCYVVEVRYREPTYEERHGPREHPYRFRYRIEAASEEAAARMAVAELERVTALSSVSWVRVVVGVDVLPAIGARPSTLTV